MESIFETMEVKGVSIFDILSKGFDKSNFTEVQLAILGVMGELYTIRTKSMHIADVLEKVKEAKGITGGVEAIKLLDEDLQELLDEIRSKLDDMYNAL